MLITGFDIGAGAVEAGYVIGNLTVENHTILDPFMGAGNFGKAALKLGRKFVRRGKS